MTEFDEKLRLALHSFKSANKMKFHEIANDCGIKPHSLYAFTSGNSGLNGEDTKVLMDYLNLTVNLEEKK
ncbi:hypothetical protein [Gracilimonas sp.]|uniref:hypothetical protein n=1 Tax=Gracilimonas sp. TaxID=1974203 RepID=UPI002870E1FB|nr:hypothetical protein [Gracilimonas sp.]